MNQLTTTTPTISSIELVEIINSMRGPDRAELLHKNFMAKIENHPGIKSAKFLAHVEISVGNGATRKSKCYNLPKREAELMVMSESLEVQTKVYDRMTALEEQLRITPPKQKARQQVPTEAFKMLPMVVRAARALGLDRNAAAISANQVVTKLTGTNVMQLMGNTHLTAEVQELVFTPSELGERMGGISGRKVNMLLAEAGLQAKKGEHWAPLPPAKGFHRVLDTGKRHSDGAMIQQIKWSESVLARLKQQDLTGLAA